MDAQTNEDNWPPAEAASIGALASSSALPSGKPTAILPLRDLRRDGGTQPRVAIDREVVEDYVRAIANGAEFPAVTVFFDGNTYWLADGFHRCEAYDQAGISDVRCEVRQGSQKDAQWYSYGANQIHGLRRSNADKQQAVRAALAHAHASGLSDRQIAEHCGVGHSMVSEYRNTIRPTVREGQLELRTGRDGRTINTSKIGKTKRGTHTKRQAARPKTAPSVSGPPRIEPCTSSTEPTDAEAAAARETNGLPVAGAPNAALNISESPCEMHPEQSVEPRDAVSGSDEREADDLAGDEEVDSPSGLRPEAVDAVNEIVARIDTIAENLGERRTWFLNALVEALVSRLN